MSALALEYARLKSSFHDVLPIKCNVGSKTAEGEYTDSFLSDRLTPESGPKKGAVFY